MKLLPKHLPVLMYHQILPKEHPHFFEHIAVNTHNLKMQISQLLNEGWKFYHLKDWLHLKHSSNKNLKAAILTFDDLSSAFIDHALPLLQSLKVTATLFPIQNMIQGKTYVNLSSKGISPIQENELIELNRLGFEIGSHGQTHQNFRSLSLNQVKIEMNESKIWLESLLNIQIQSICYPIGGVDQRIIQVARDAGFKVGVTTLKGTLQLQNDDLSLKRVNIKNDILDSKLTDSMSSCYYLRHFIFRPFRAKYRFALPSEF